MRRHVDVDLAGHDLACFPARHDPADGVGVTADHRRLGRRHDGDHHVLDALLFEFFTDLLGGHLDRRHRSPPAGQPQAQQRATADDLDAVLQGQRAGDDGGGDLTQ